MKRTVKTSTFVPAPRDLVFETFTNHESYKQLPGVLSSKLLTEGNPEPSNGLGALREIRTIAFTLVEEVVGVERPLHMDYLFHKWPIPVPHAGGRMAFEEVAGGTIVHWETSYETDVSWLLKLGFPAYSVFNKTVIKSLPLMLKQVTIRKNV